MLEDKMGANDERRVRLRRPSVRGRGRRRLAHLGLADYDLGGFSLGARTTVQGVGERLKPARAVLAGMGLEGLTGWQKRKDFFVDAIAMFDTAAREDKHWLAIQFMNTMKVDPRHHRHLQNTDRGVASTIPN